MFDQSTIGRCAAAIAGTLLLSHGPSAAGQQAALPDKLQQLAESEFSPLFNGRDLQGWTGNTKGYSVADGVLICSREAGNLFTEAEFADFVMRFEFKLTADANNGIGLRAPQDAKWVSSEGIELQILDEGMATHRDLKPYQFHGSVYGVIPAKRGHLRPLGEWNEQEIECLGRRIVVILNGIKILDANLDDYSDDPAPDGYPRLGLKRTSGHLGLLGHESHVEFRNLRICPIEKTSVSAKQSDGKNNPSK